MRFSLYFPIDKDSQELNVRPNIENQKDELVAMLKSDPVEDTNEPVQEHGYNNHNTPPAERNFMRFHKSWYTSLAYSHGISTGHLQDFSLTSYVTELTPIFELMVAKREVLPFVIFRVFQNVTNNKLNLIEYELEKVKITSLSTGGSGGEDRFTENITLEPEIFYHKLITIDMETYEYTKFSTSKFNTKTLEGSRTVHGEAARKALGIEKFQSLDFSDPKQSKIATDLGISRILYEYELTITVHEKPNVFKKLKFDTPSLQLLKSLIAKTFNRPESDIVAVYSSGLEIENDKDLSKIEKDVHVFCRFSDGTYNVTA